MADDDDDVDGRVSILEGRLLLFVKPPTGHPVRCVVVLLYCISSSDGGVQGHECYRTRRMIFLVAVVVVVVVVIVAVLCLYSGSIYLSLPP